MLIKMLIRSLTQCIPPYELDIEYFTYSNNKSGPQLENIPRWGKRTFGRRRAKTY